MHDLFLFEQTGVDDNKVAEGIFKATGLRPRCLEQLQAHGQTVSPMLFERRVLESERIDTILPTSVR